MKIDSDLIVHDDRGIFPLPNERPDAYHARAQIIYKGAEQSLSTYEQTTGDELESPLYPPAHGIAKAIDSACRRMRHRFRVNLDWVPIFESDMGAHLLEPGKAGCAVVQTEGRSEDPQAINTFIALNNRLQLSHASVLRHKYIHAIRRLARIPEDVYFRELLADIDSPLYPLRMLLQPLTSAQIGIARIKFRHLFGSYGDNVLLRFPQERILNAGSTSFCTKKMKESICRKAESGNLASEMLCHRAGW